MQKALDDADVPPQTASAVVNENAQARIAGLRCALGVLALISLLALLFTSGIPTVQPGVAEAKRATARDAGRRLIRRRQGAACPERWRP